MTPLPQSRKSPEEIAKLRESFGVPATGQAAVQETVPAEKPKPVPAKTAPPEPDADHQSKPVRSLRKSERLDDAVPRLESPPDSNIPHQRHSPEELEQIRRREVLSMMNTAPNRRLFPAHPALIAPGYLAIVVAAAGLWFYQIPLWATAICAVISFAVATLLFLRHPVSRHHAAFIAVLAVLLLAFSALYYFPQPRHAT